MSEALTCHRDVVNLWKRAADLAAPVGVEAGTVCAWRWNGIPPERFPAVVAAARKIGRADVTVDLLHALAPARRKRGRPRGHRPEASGARA